MENLIKASFETFLKEKALENDFEKFAKELEQANRILVSSDIQTLTGQGREILRDAQGNIRFIFQDGELISGENDTGNSEVTKPLN